MPLYGQLDLATVAQRLPRLRDLDTEAWHLPKAEMLQLLIEVPRSTTDRLLPRAMHPAVPSYVVLAVTHYPESPVGPFTLAVLRLGSRAGAHPRGFVLGAYASEAAAATALRERWGDVHARTELDDLAEKVAAGDSDPYAAADVLLESLTEGA